MSTPSQREAAARVAQALKHIERAQGELFEACSEVSSVIGLVAEWERLGELAGQVKEEWHRLHQVSGPFELDGMAKDSLARKAAGR